MNGAILLDTCACIWIINNERMRPEAVSAIDEAFDGRAKVFVSPITAWEIGIQARKGRFPSTLSPRRWLDVLLTNPQVALAPMTPQILLESSFLPGRPPSDPADRIIAATAREHGYVVMTRDREMVDYGVQGHLAVLEC